WVRVFALAGWAAAGAAVRLRCRRRQRRLALEAAGSARFALPGQLPERHARRGVPWIAIGCGLCLLATAVLVKGLHRDLAAPDGAAYDAVGQQLTALPLLALGTTLAGRGLAARSAVRRLRRGLQPALVVGVRATPSGHHHWLCPDAATRSGRPLLAYPAWQQDTMTSGRLLVTGSADRLRDAHRDVDPAAEPFEAVLYGIACEGSEAVLEYAVYSGDDRITTQLTAVPLLPRRWHRLGWWQEAGESHRRTVRREQALQAKFRQESEARERAGLTRTTSLGTTGAAGLSGAAGASWAAGSSTASAQPRRTDNNTACGGCGSSCGGCGGCGCG
ncbi:hypothetical protein, partial [Streptomyces bambusae]